MDGPLLALAGVSKSFGAVAALRAVDLRLMAGEAHALVGDGRSGRPSGRDGQVRCVHNGHDGFAERGREAGVPVGNLRDGHRAADEDGPAVALRGDVFTGQPTAENIVDRDRAPVGPA